MTKKQKNVLNRIIIAIVLLIVITVFKTIVPVPGYVEFILYLIPYFVIGHDILRKSIKNISHGQVFDENFLMAVATIGAMCLGEYLEGSAVMVFYQIGELFQSIAVGKSRKNIAALMDIRPDYANIMVDGEIEEVDPDDVEIGSEIIVNPGEKVPIDGIIVEGDTTLNTSALTGESVPRNAHCGDEIYSGSINMTARITVKTTKEFGESTVSKILDLVENSSMKKSKTENFITKFAKYYTPVVCYSALALAVIPPIVLTIMGQPAHVSDWIFRALTFLVISCPCALVISIPLSFFGGIGCASKNGILVKGSNYLETLSDVKYFVFDKTGTLTKGVFEVTDVVPAEGFNKYNLLEYAAYAESASTHPISVSLKKAYNQKIDNTLVDHIQEIAGHGVEADYNDHHILAGNAKLMKLKGVGYSAYTKAGTLVYVAVDDKYAGCIVISDIIKDHAKEAISGLKSLGAKETVMLTGDSASTADFVANTIGIDTVHSELLPADKVEEVEKLLANKSDKEKLAFVGDGINDAPVLSRADIGIAMGGLGSDAAIEAADVVLMDDDPLKISKAIKIAKKCIHIVYENIYFAIGIKLVCLVLGAIGIANMWVAIFADVGVMIIAVLNAIRALNVKNL